MKLTLALAQMNTVLGGVTANLEKHIQLIRSARQDEADVVHFPELSLTGYYLMDLAPEVALRPSPQEPVFAALLAESEQIDILVGFPEIDRRGRVFISQAYLSQGEIRHVHRKVYLPTYAMFDEGRYFAAGERVQSFETRFGRAGMLICEDTWHVSPAYLLWQDGADLFYFSSSAAGTGLTGDGQMTSTRWAESIYSAYATLFTVFISHNNRVGFEDGTNFPGASCALAPGGNLLARLPEFEEALQLTELDLNQLRRTRARLPLLRDEKAAWFQRELGRILDQNAQQGDTP